MAKLIVGLGNPGAEYGNNRHNIGFMAVGAIADKLGFPPFKTKFNALYSDATIDGVKVIILKPQTYMNRSGGPVLQALSFYKINPVDVFVFHDELDISLGKIKTKLGGGSAGHNGLKSIDASIGANYNRIRIGIDHPGDKDMVSDYVLSDFKRSEEPALEKVMSAIAENSKSLIASTLGDFTNQVALALQPPKKGDLVRTSEREDPAKRGGAVAGEKFPLKQKIEKKEENGI